MRELRHWPAFYVVVLVILWIALNVVGAAAYVAELWRTQMAAGSGPIAILSSSLPELLLVLLYLLGPPMLLVLMWRAGRRTSI